ncbi:MAG TPA: hypothetical protein VJT73_04965 [Polyangiaceae bacterium]|nr:hypothetical protein [Polyangiaceae bacterium]
MTTTEGSQAQFRTDQVMRAVQEASVFVTKGQKPQALGKYKEVLALDPAHPEALAWVEDYLRTKRQYAELRDVLMQAVRAPNTTPETRKQQLLEVAGLCETQLRDLETAVQAWKQICSLDRGDVSARDHLRRLLERGGRWDELALVLEQEASATSDVEDRVALEKKLAQLHEVKRKDFASAGEAWARIASLLAGDEAPLSAALKLFEKGGRKDLACEAIAENAGAIGDKSSRAALYVRMGDLYEKEGRAAEAGEAYVLAAESDASAKNWEAAERCLVSAEKWGRAAFAVGQRAEFTADAKARAALLVRASDMLVKAGDDVNALRYLESASGLDPNNDDYAAEVEKRYTEAARFTDLASFHLSRAEKLDDKTKRAALRKRNATLQAERLGDKDAARQTLLSALEDGDDAEILAKLADDAESRGEHEATKDFLHRLVAIARAANEKVAIALREAKLLAGPLDDAEGAIARYLFILDDVDPKNREAVRCVAELEEKRDNQKGLAEALERELEIVTEDAEKLELAQKLASLYEGPLDDAKRAIRALDLVRSLDAEDFEAMSRLQVLCEKVQDWPRVAELLQALIEIEGDDDELSALTRKRADILVTKLERGDEALAALAGPADSGDGPCREAYVELADRLGWKGIVAAKLVEWHGESAPTPKRNEALRSAFDRFLGVGRDEEAVKVATELARSKGADQALAEKLEEIAARLKDLEALSVAHDLLAHDLTGPDRAAELVRQAEVLVNAGVEPTDAQQHGEMGLGSVPPLQVEPLLERLAKLVDSPGPVIDVYERQVGRCKVPSDRLSALSRAAQVAAQRGVPERAKSFYELALSAGVPEETLMALELSATQGDRERGGTALRRTLAEALSGGGQGSRDGGRTRGLLLRRAAQIAQRDLGDIEKAFGWLGDALVAHVDAASLDALEELAMEVDDLKRAEATIGRVLAEVFDGPLVRQLLARRVKMRKEQLGDKAGAAEDLKKLHDLSPADVAVTDELSLLLTELGDFRGMVHVFEDQILKGKDPAVRAELARKVAKLWEEQLQDPREAADAWRRVLRMKPGDPDAQAGLERAKSGMLTQRKSEVGSRTSIEDDEPAAPLPVVSPVVAPASVVVEAAPPEPEEAVATPNDITPAPIDEKAAREPVAAPEVGSSDEPGLAVVSASAVGISLGPPGEPTLKPPASYDPLDLDASATEEVLDVEVPAEGATDLTLGNGVAHASADDEDVLSVDDTDLVDDAELIEEEEFDGVEAQDDEKTEGSRADKPRT